MTSGGAFPWTWSATRKGSLLRRWAWRAYGPWDSRRGTAPSRAVAESRAKRTLARMRAGEPGP